MNNNKWRQFWCRHRLVTRQSDGSDVCNHCKVKMLNFDMGMFAFFVLISMSVVLLMATVYFAIVGWLAV